jgi:hypothetical protein
MHSPTPLIAMLCGLFVGCAPSASGDAKHPEHEPRPKHTAEPYEQADAPAEPEDADSNGVFAEDGDVEHWMQFYYQHPQPELIVLAFRRLSESESLDKAADRRGLAFFLARILAANDERAGEWADETNDLPDLHRALFAQALTLADTERCDAAVLRIADNTEDASLASGLRRMHEMPRVKPLELPLDNPGVVGLIWAEFAATGDPAYIERLASIAFHITERKDPELMVVAVKATHELTLNAVDHPVVLATLKRLAAAAEGDQQKALHNCIDDAGVILDQRAAQAESAPEPETDSDPESPE